MANSALADQSAAIQETHPAVRRAALSRAAIYLVLIVGAAAAILPFLYTVSVSLMNLTEATGGRALPATPQWSNYVEAWHDAQFSQYFMNSVKITLISVGGALVFCALAAYAFAQMEFPGKNFLFTLLFVDPDAARGDHLGAELHHRFLAGPHQSGTVDQQLAGVDDPFHGECVWHISAAPVLHADPERALGLGPDRRVWSSAIPDNRGFAAFERCGHDAGTVRVCWRVECAGMADSGDNHAGLAAHLLRTARVSG